MRKSIELLLIFFILASTAWAQNTPVATENKIPVEIIGGELSFDNETQNMHAESNAKGDPSVIFEMHSITAHHIHYSQTSKIIYATGAVRLWDEGNILRGDYLEFYIDSKEGVLQNLKSSEILDGLYFTGETLVLGHRPAEPTKDAGQPEMVREFTLFKGTVTPNDLPVPHYHIKYNRIVFAPKVRATITNMFFNIGDWPILYAPVFSKSLADHELTYFIDVDSYSDLGMAFMNRLLWKPDDIWEFNLYGDYFTKAGIGKGAKVEMDIPGPYGPKGMIYANHIKQEEPDNDRIYDGKDRFNLALEYQQDLPYDMRLSAKGHRMSDSEYRWDYRGPESAHRIDLIDMQEDAVSHVNLTKLWDDQSLRATFASRLDPFYYNGLPFIERKPQLHFEQYPYSIYDSNVFADFRLDYGRYRREEGVTFPLDERNLFSRTSFYDEVDRLDAELRVSYPIHLPKRFTLQPWIGFRGTNYSDPMHAEGNIFTEYNFDDETRLMPEGGVDISTRTVYEFKPFLDKYAKMRTVVEPIVQYGYYHPDTDLEEITTGTNIRFPYIDPVDEFRFKMHRFSAMVRTKIQGKTAEGGTGDFMRLSAGAVYDVIPDENLRYDSFELFDDFANHDDYRFSDLVEDFSIYPFDWLTFGNSLQFDIEDSELRSSYTYTTVQPIDPVHVTTGYLTYMHPLLDNDEQRDVTLNVNWKLSNKWQAYYTSWYDIDDEVFRRNHVGLVRDMYDFYGIIQVGQRRHPTLGTDFKISIGLQFWGLNKSQTQEAPTLFY
jgi:lipopolysaccharide assembly outer membrane protein LptD (OstA)